MDLTDNWPIKIVRRAYALPTQLAVGRVRDGRRWLHVRLPLRLALVIRLPRERKSPGVGADD